MNNKILIGLIVLLLLAGGAILLTKSGGSKQAATTQAVPTAATQATATPTQMVNQGTITVTKDGFSPASITVKAGTKVVWTNQSGGTVTVNSDPHPVHTAYPPLNLGAFPNGASVQLTFDKPGTYGYHNHLNPSQHGTVIVQ